MYGFLSILHGHLTLPIIVLLMDTDEVISTFCSRDRCGGVEGRDEDGRTSVSGRR